VARTLAISRSSLYYRKKPRGSRADRTYDEQIVVACGEKLAWGYRRVAWWLQGKKGLPVNQKRVLRVMRERGLPQAIRCDNGPELTSRHFLAWCIERKIEVVHIEPGKPVQNAHVESFHGKLRDECLNASWFQNLFEARRKIAAWRTEYHEERPHSSLGYETPSAFARRMAALRSPTAPCAPPFGTNPETEAMSSGGSNVV